MFNTSLSGYQEILTDPSYKGQFVVFTYPHIGNVGINLDDMESGQCHLGGVIIRDLSLKVSNYRSAMTLDAYLKEQGVLGIANVDTRAITRRLRVTGCLNGVISTDAARSDAELVEATRAWTIVGKDLIKEVTCAEPYEWRDATEDEWEFAAAAKARGGEEPYFVVAYDFGIKHNILRRLASFGCRITVVPADFPAEKVLAMNPDGVFFSNGPVSAAAPRGGVVGGGGGRAGGWCAVGVLERPARVPAWSAAQCSDRGRGPGKRGEQGADSPARTAAPRPQGDPSAVPYAVENAKKVLGKKPVFGICMGHQVLGQAFGASTFKLKFGHHGGNHPIRYNLDGRIEISAQNHNFAVDPATLPPGVEVSHINLNDGTCAGMVYPSMKAMTIQVREGTPGVERSAML